MPLAKHAHLLLLATLALGGCPKGGLQAGPNPRGEATYGVAVAVASGARVVTSLYTLEVSHVSGDTWSFATTHSEGSWEESGNAILYDSDTPRDTDPWPVVYQHALSALPVLLRLDGGTPVELVEADAWREAGLEAMRAVERLPPEALTTGMALLDEEGVVRDMARNFPGTPPPTAWVRDVTLAAVPATLTEQCTAASERDKTTWTCVGTAAGPTQGTARLHEVTSQTKVVVDRFGLVELDTQWAGTLVMLAPDQQGVIDRPIAGHRVVQRTAPGAP